MSRSVSSDQVRTLGKFIPGSYSGPAFSRIMPLSITDESGSVIPESYPTLAFSSVSFAFNGNEQRSLSVLSPARNEQRSIRFFLVIPRDSTESASTLPDTHGLMDVSGESPPRSPERTSLSVGPGKGRGPRRSQEENPRILACFSLPRRGLCKCMSWVNMDLSTKFSTLGSLRR